MKTQLFEVRYEMPGYSGKYWLNTFVHAKSPGNALSAALRTLSTSVGIRRGAIAEARRGNNRVMMRVGPGQKPLFAWVVEGEGD